TAIVGAAALGAAAPFALVGVGGVRLAGAMAAAAAAAAALLGLLLERRRGPRPGGGGRFAGPAPGGVLLPLAPPRALAAFPARVGDAPRARAHRRLRRLRGAAARGHPPVERGTAVVRRRAGRDRPARRAAGDRAAHRVPARAAGRRQRLVGGRPVPGRRRRGR